MTILRCVERDVILSVDPESLMRTAVKRHRMNQLE